MNKKHFREYIKTTDNLPDITPDNALKLLIKLYGKKVNVTPFSRIAEYLRIAYCVKNKKYPNETDISNAIENWLQSSISNFQ